MSFLKMRLAAVLCATILAGPVPAQDSFAPRLYVGDRVITEYEVAQRVLFLRALRSPGDLEEEALRGLVEDRLRQTEAERLELTLTDEEVKEGMEEFASRANLTADALTVELEKIDIAPETFRDFVSAGILWRKVIRAKFAGKVAITETDVDRALEALVRPRALKVLASELVIALPEGTDPTEKLALADELSRTISGETAFADAAREYSAAPTAAEGGRLDWVPVANLPAAIGAAVLALGPGEVSDPIQVPGAVVLFLLRDVGMDETAEPVTVTVEWAEFLVPDDPKEIARLRASVDDCNDLYQQAKGLPQDRLTITKALASDVPGDVGLELARLDPGETSVALQRAGFRRFLMLCGREPTPEEPISRDAVRERVINQKLEGLAARYLEELRAATIIREP
ncbi:MAG: peptidylprolyl isomerase [Rhodobacterales bacterium]|nr:peptidylprolyl isomerase [Rhodobacterales bacterium]